MTTAEEHVVRRFEDSGIEIQSGVEAFCRVSPSFVNPASAIGLLVVGRRLLALRDGRVGVWQAFSNATPGRELSSCPVMELCVDAPSANRWLRSRHFRGLTVAGQRLWVRTRDVDVVLEWIDVDH